MRMLTIFLLILACLQLACSSSGEEGGQAEDALSPSSTSTGNPQPVSRAAVQYHGEESFEERIIRSDAIVIARLDRTTNEVVTGSGGTYDGKNFPALKFHLTVSAYLKGSGANNITALWIRRDPYDTRQEAEDVVPDFAASRDTSWDGRAAILFLTKEADLATNGDGFFSAEVRALNDYITMGFSLSDRHSKLWLPAAGTEGTGDSQEFLLAVPEVGITTPTITVGELKSRVAAINTELAAGDGSDSYRQCLTTRYRHLRIEEFRVTQPSYTGPPFQPDWDGSFASGQPAGSEVYKYAYGSVITENGTETKTTLRIDGEDAVLFSIREGARQPGSRENHRQFSYFVESARPIPAGTYQFNHHLIAGLACDITYTFEMTANVVAPKEVLHEAFFDPVTDGTAVAADSTNGVLKPATFTDVNGAAATLGRIAWEPGGGESGTVKLRLIPHDGIADHEVNFIALDGSVPLSLRIADATVDAAISTLSWTVASQPWQSGDMLMLRIRKGCSGGTAVTNPGANSGLVSDCEAVLSSKDTLRGTATLNWSLDTAITSWDGVTLGGTPNRVAELDLSSRSLTGSIPSSLGSLSRLTHLNLSSNSLTGEIPEEIGQLSDLVELRLSGNSLTGCIPLPLKDVATNDLSSLNLLYCQPPAPENLTAGTVGETSIPLSWDAVTNASKYRVEYRLGGDLEWTVHSDTITSTTHTVDELVCDSEYQFRVSAYGDGVVYAEMWGAEFGETSVETAACNVAPVFDPTSYTFTVAEDAEMDDEVGTVTATDEDEDDDLTYSITAGNEDGKFDIDGSSGAITVAGGLDHETTPSYTLTVVVDDGNGGTATASVIVTVTDVAEDPPPAPTGVTATLTNGTFTISWTALDGAAKYEAQHKTDATDSEWTTLPETTGVSTTYTPTGGPACGTTYQFRVRAYGDGETYTEMWGAESEVATVETAACNVAPEFDQASYLFLVLDTANTGSAVGTVSATDSDTDDTVRHAITGGNEDGKFSINNTTGQLTVAGTLDIATTPSYALTVEASDGRGGKGAATVSVALTIAACSNGTVIPRPEDYPLLVRDCSILLTAKDTLRGTANLNWSADIHWRQWQGIFTGYLNSRVSYDSDTVHVTAVVVARSGMNGIIPPILGSMTDLHRLDLDDNALTGEIPAVLGNIESLQMLHLLGNRLTGSIPAELGNLRELRILSLYANDLTGNMPPELGNLTKLEQLLLDDNDFTGQLPDEFANMASLERLFVRESRLTGQIPEWLTTLENLEHLYLEGNDFTGCIPDGLRDVENHDLDRPGLGELPDCSSMAARPNTPATGAPTISGTAQVGETLTVDTTGISDVDGLTNVSYSYQWVRNDGTDDTDITDATSSTYTLVSADEGQTIKVRVSFTDDAGNEESLSSAATAAVGARANTPATGVPTISGRAQVGETLTADTTGISDADGLVNVSYSYQWVRNDGTDDSDISGATGSSYTLVSADQGDTIKVDVSFTDDAGNAETLTSAATTAVAARPNSAATGIPTISGTVQVGETLTVSTTGISDADGLVNVTYSYQWVRNDGTDDTDITDATSSTYTLVSADEGQTIKVRVTFTDDAGNAETLNSSATQAVVNPIWSVQMTVRDFGGGDVGANSPEMFSNETGSMRIKWLWYSGSARRLHLAFGDVVTEREHLTLYVGNIALTFPSGDSGFTFTNIDISWTAGQVVEVSIVRQAPPADTS